MLNNFLRFILKERERVLFLDIARKIEFIFRGIISGEESLKKKVYF